MERTARGKRAVGAGRRIEQALGCIRRFPLRAHDPGQPGRSSGQIHAATCPVPWPTAAATPGSWWSVNPGLRCAPTGSPPGSARPGGDAAPVWPAGSAPGSGRRIRSASASPGFGVRGMRTARRKRGRHASPRCVQPPFHLSKTWPPASASRRRPVRSGSPSASGLLQPARLSRRAASRSSAQASRLSSRPECATT